MSKLARMHTAEHLLSAVMRKFYAAPRNLEFHLNEIGDFDEQPCRGQHVANTEEIGHFEISSYEQRENGRVRIRFKVL